jgi:hypothetical protein
MEKQINKAGLPPHLLLCPNTFCELDQLGETLKQLFSATEFVAHRPKALDNESGQRFSGNFLEPLSFLL